MAPVEVSARPWKIFRGERLTAFLEVGPHLDLRIHLAQAKFCVLVATGARADGRAGVRACGRAADGTTELIAMADGYRESAEPWAGLLRDAARRGMRAPALASATALSRLAGGPRGGVPRNPSSEVLGSQNGQRRQRPAVIGSARYRKAL